MDDWTSLTGKKTVYRCPHGHEVVQEEYVASDEVASITLSINGKSTKPMCPYCVISFLDSLGIPAMEEVKEND